MTHGPVPATSARTIVKMIIDETRVMNAMTAATIRPRLSASGLGGTSMMSSLAAAVEMGAAADMFTINYPPRGSTVAMPLAL